MGNVDSRLKAREISNGFKKRFISPGIYPGISVPMHKSHPFSSHLLGLKPLSTSTYDIHTTYLIP